MVGAGRLGRALVDRLRATGATVVGPLGRGADGAGFGAVLLCVPDAEIAGAAALIEPGRLVGHCSGATGLDVLAPHEAFSLHPLMTVTGEGADFTGAGAAIAGTSPAGLELARGLAERLHMQPVEIAPGDRVAYHAAASIASNFLVTLESMAEELAATAGVERPMLVPLVAAAVQNWGRLGARRALTGPVARGDRETVAAQRRAVAERTPELLGLFDTLVQATETLAGRPAGQPAAGPSAAGTLRIVRRVEELGSLVGDARRAGGRIGLVPTMGALHEGHLSLMRQARKDCDLVVASLFVNPAQFNDQGDLEAYPRDEARDARLAEEAGVDVLFAPALDEVYPAGFATTVQVAGLTERLEGASRGRGHFDGVTTVVSKLLNMVAPDVAYFGQKDAQQVMVIKRLVRDLDWRVQIAVCPTVRDADGLALSSRNAHLSPAERRRAVALSRSLRVAAQAVAEGERDPEAVRARGLRELREAGVQVEYFEFVSPETFEPVQQVNADVLAVVAGRVGGTRLIDNQMLTTTAWPVAGSERQGDGSMYSMTPTSTVQPDRLVA